MVLFFFIGTVTLAKGQQQALPITDVAVETVTDFTLRSDWKKSIFTLHIKNVGTTTVDLSNAVVQCYLSKDAVIGDDVAAGGLEIKASQAGQLLKGETRNLTGLWFAYNELNLMTYPYVVITLKTGIKEANSKNNTIIAKHGHGAIVVPDKPDLEPTKGFATNLDWRRGEDNESFSFKIKNNGIGDAGPSIAKFTFYTSNEDKSKKEYLSIPTPSISAGGIVQLKHRFPDGCLAHDCFFEMTVDAGNTVAESVETNNAANGRMGGK